nr:cytochrome P450 6B4-like [Halyomorpha halys]
MSQRIASIYLRTCEMILELFKSDSFGYTMIIISLIVSRIMLTSELVAFAAVWGFMYFFLNVYWAMNYWKVRGVKHFKPWPIIGNMARVLKLEHHLAYYYDEVYNAFPGEKMVGMYEFMTPSLVLRDIELIEQVLIKDFSTYPDHGPFLMEPKSILFESVFAMSGIRWRAIRYE